MTRILDLAGLDGLIASLARRGYPVVGPTVRDGAIVYDELESAAALPAGWTDVQDGGSYRLERRDDEARFGYASGPSSWKRFLLPPRVRLWHTGAELDVEEEPLPERPLAFVGVRPCELAAIAVQDRVLLGGRYADRDYAARREGLFVVAVNCHEPGGTCFCDSMGTGPTVSRRLRPRAHRARSGPRYLAEAGSPRGRRSSTSSAATSLPRRTGRRPPSSADRAVASMGRDARHRRHPRPAPREPRAPALGRGRRALPDLRQLHARLPDLLLHERSRTRTTWRAAPTARASGTRASRSTTRTSTAARSGSRRGPATASGSPTSSAPGTTSSAARAASAAAAASPGARSASTSPRRSPRFARPERKEHEDARRSRRGEPGVRRPRPAVPRADRRLRLEHRLQRRRLPVPRGRPGGHLLPRPPRARHARDLRPGPRRRHDRDDRRRRGGRLVVALPAVPLALRRPRARPRARGRLRRRLPAREDRHRQRLRLRAARPLLAGDARAAPGHPPPAPGRLWQRAA